MSSLFFILSVIRLIRLQSRLSSSISSTFTSTHFCQSLRLAYPSGRAWVYSLDLAGQPRHLRSPQDRQTTSLRLVCAPSRGFRLFTRWSPLHHHSTTTYLVTTTPLLPSPTHTSFPYHLVLNTNTSTLPSTPLTPHPTFPSLLCAAITYYPFSHYYKVHSWHAPNHHYNTYLTIITILTTTITTITSTRPSIDTYLKHQKKQEWSN